MSLYKLLDPLKKTQPAPAKEANAALPPSSYSTKQESLHSVFQSIFKSLQNISENTLPEYKNLKNLQKKLKDLSPPFHFNRLNQEFFGVGPLEPLIHDKEISEIIINGHKNIFYEKKGRLYPIQDHFLSKLTFHNFIHRILDEAKTVLSLKRPFADGNWRGWRIHVSTAPIVHVDFHLSLRRHPKNPWCFNKLQNTMWAPEKAIQIIKSLIQNKNNILIAGPTSSGKTSVLNACLQCLPPSERVITIEDSSELTLPNYCSTKLLTRTDNHDHSSLLSYIDQSELVKQSLRMRPDRIIMGETRGKEAKDLLLALATGHKGSIGTIHAQSHKQALSRLEMLIQMGAPAWSTHTIKQMIALSIECIFVVDRAEGQRKLKGIYKITGLESTGFLFEKLYTHLSEPDSFCIS